ncbi:hydrogenase formation protein HypD [Leeia sp. TBRC 13508]|uniref:Hydrogenase maturation factor n=1 Tax=Leeia speluncae TaxID=2884804 RepID=A0ABS8D2H6_9NEIS|nr:hydrogenase formation protein HypD [Leeia speluncae]MCB6182390.1 hydrogenase formation protein HypD [Leeia speluncae]
MKYVDEFRRGDVARGIAKHIAGLVDPAREYRLMEFCGGHTHAIARYGLTGLLPSNIRLIHGPGCPVCVLPIGRIDSAIELVLQHQVILCTYGDTLRVPASNRMSLYKARAEGGDVRVIYSTSDALRIARENPDRQVVFFGIGFETTTPPTAMALKTAKTEGQKNFSVFCNHVLTPPAMQHLLSAGDAVELDGFIGPSHVSTVIGSDPYQAVAKQYRKPVVIAGFEPLDVLQATAMLVEDINHGRDGVSTQFTRAVTPEGNQKARSVVMETMMLRDTFEWRGLGQVPHSALAIHPDYADFDAEQRFALPYRHVPDHKACECGAILRGQKQPSDCKVFGIVCTPDNPLGSCMVSSEGACAAHYHYGRFVKSPTQTSVEEGA